MRSKDSKKETLLGKQVVDALHHAIMPDTVDEIGFVSLSSLEQNQNFDHDFATRHLPSAQTIIVLIKQMQSDALSQAPARDYQQESKGAYDCLHRCSQATVRWLENGEYQAVWLGSQKLQYQKPLAVAAGLGEIGDSKLFVSARCGPGVHLETIVTSAVIRDTQPWPPSRYVCLHCARCQKACPAEALAGGLIDRDKCKAFRATLLDGPYCGLCMQACLSHR